MPSITTINYALPPEDYFWQWSKGDGDLEWSSSENTIALQIEVLTLLHALQEVDTVPPLGSLLLVLSACGENYSSRHNELANWLIENQTTPKLTDASYKLLESLKYSLHQIESLPEELRKGSQAKLNLAFVIFQRSSQKVSSEKAQLILDELRMEPPRKWKQEISNLPSRGRFLRDTKCLLESLATLGPGDLENLLRTGVDFPELGNIELPEEPEASLESLPLLLQLEKMGGELRGLSALAKQIIALLSVPKPIRGEAELPIGGVSDIANKGTPDRLVPSELAYDDLTMVTRIAQNEALYFQREHPPEAAPLQRLILMDHGLRYWGLPRLFHLATALGLVHHPSAESAESPEVYSSRPHGYELISLSDVEDIQEELASLPPHLDATAPLLSFIESYSLSVPEGVPDCFLITSPHNLDDQPFVEALAKLCNQLVQRGGRLFLLLLDGEGNVEFLESFRGGNRLLVKTRLSLEDFLPDRPERKPTQKKKHFTANPHLPALEFYKHKIPPLLFSAPNIFQPQSFFTDGHQFSIGLGPRASLFLRPEKKLCGRQLLASGLPGRNQFLGVGQSGQIYVACSADKPGDFCRVFQLNIEGDREEIEISKSRHSFPRRAFFSNSAVVFVYSDLAEAFSLIDGRLVTECELDQKSFLDPQQVTFNGRIITLKDKSSNFPQVEDVDSENNAIHIVPEGITFQKKSRIALFNNQNFFSLRPKGVRWVQLNAQPHSQGAIFEEIKSPDDQAPWTIYHANLSKKIEAYYDDRGFLHLCNIRSAQADTWSFLLECPQSAAWNSEHGLISSSAHLLPPNGKPKTSHPALNAFIDGLRSAV